MSALPLAPLTRQQLNARFERVQSHIAWRVAACAADGEIRDHDRDYLFALADDLEELQAARVVRP